MSHIYCLQPLVPAEFCADGILKIKLEMRQFGAKNWASRIFTFRIIRIVTDVTSAYYTGCLL